MNYRDMLGFSDKQPKKKVVKKHEPSITEGLKKQFGDTINEGPASDYSKFIHDIETTKSKLHVEVMKLVKELKKKGLNSESKYLEQLYIKNSKGVVGFGSKFKLFMMKLL